tara:strand:- start:1810 stop:2730 length:921 start_codon:yes stop_codon:yes gene_type:complete
MCLIIHKPKNKRIPVRILEKAKVVNPHGFGITYLDDGKTLRSLSYKSVNKLVDTDRPIVCHFRFATVGSINLSNVHPFAIDDGYILYSNGTVKGYGTDAISDVAYIASDVLPRLRKKDWLPFLELTETRFALIDVKNGRVKRVGKWFDQGGVHYSKNNCFVYDMQRGSETHRVAVYGTLKKGYGNHRLLADSEFIGKAKTEYTYPLLVNGLPYLYDEMGVGEQVRLEVYDVDDKTFDALDSLEGHPTFYERRKIWVQMDDWSKAECWVYFINQELPRGTTREQMLYSYTGQSFQRNNAWYKSCIKD